MYVLVHSFPLGKGSHSAVAFIWLINGQALASAPLRAIPALRWLLLLLLRRDETAAGRLQPAPRAAQRPLLQP